MFWACITSYGCMEELYVAAVSGTVIRIVIPGL